MNTRPHDNPDPAASGLPPGRAAELADLYAAGALSTDEAAELEQRVVLGDPEYVAEFQRVRGTMEMLLGSVEEIEPPARVRDALAHAVGAADRARQDDEESPFAAHAHAEHTHERASGGAGIAIVRMAEGKWRPTGIRGVRYRTLHADRRANRRTILLQMDAGMELPEHEHAGTEEIFMISGDLSIAGTVLGPGDYLNVAAGADHGVPRTTGGCVCLIVSPYVPVSLRSLWGFFRAAVRSMLGGR